MCVSILSVMPLFMSFLLQRGGPRRRRFPRRVQQEENVSIRVLYVWDY